MEVGNQRNTPNPRTTCLKKKKKKKVVLAYKSDQEQRGLLSF